MESVANAATRFRALIASSAASLTRRIHRAGTIADNDVALIAEALAVPLNRVTEWAHATCAEPMLETELTESLISMGTS